MKTISMMIGVVLLLIAHAGCGDVNLGEGGGGVKSQALDRSRVASGKIDGVDWTFVSGAATVTEGKLMIELASIENDKPCDVFGPKGDQLLFTRIPEGPGETQLSMENTLTFFSSKDGQSMNYIATEGQIVIDEVTAIEVKGALVSTFDDSNHINGTFTLTLCN